MHRKVIVVQLLPKRFDITLSLSCVLGLIVGGPATVVQTRVATAVLHPAAGLVPEDLHLRERRLQMTKR